MEAIWFAAFLLLLALVINKGNHNNRGPKGGINYG